jgi:predicted acyltransferase
MSEQKRLLSLDVFRGMTVALMVLVNNPGTWSAVYPALKHAEWHGWTPTDFVFPFFVFIVGIAIPIALGKRIEEGLTKDVYWKILKRSLWIFGLGLIQMGFPFFDVSKTTMPIWVQIITYLLIVGAIGLFFMDKFRESVYVTLALTVFLAIFYFTQLGFPIESFQKLRVPGVLQRLALCFFFTSLIFLWTDWKQQIYLFLILCVGYWVIMLYGGNGDLSVEGSFAGYVDRFLLTEWHIYKPKPMGQNFYDPEGILSTLPSIATCLIGVLCGTWLKRKDKSDLEKVSAMFVVGCVLTSIGWVWDFWFPINKPLWTSSYVMFMGGLGLCSLAICYWLIDIKGYKNWIKPFVIFGTNALALYFASAIFARILARIAWTTEAGIKMNGQKWIYETFFAPLASPLNASLMFALVYILLWLFLMWLLYRKKIFIKV